jgi:iron complex outermembrane recepter protein
VVTRYIDDMYHSQLVTNPASTATGTDATWYTDLLFNWDVSDNLSLRMGVNNVAGQSPRLYSPPVQAGTDPSMFDVLGRRYFIGLDYRL